MSLKNVSILEGDIRTEAQNPQAKFADQPGVGLLGRDGEKLIDLGVAQTVDASALQAMCEWWGAYQKPQQAEPADSGEAYKRSIAVASAFKHWETLASKFGMNAKDREKITARPFSDEESVAGQFLR